MRTIAERRHFSSSSNHSMAGRSRWLVGSSSRRISGAGASTRTSAARFAAGQRRRTLLAREPKVVEQRTRPVRIVVLGKCTFHVGANAWVGGEIGLLRKVADRNALLQGALAPVSLQETGGDLEKRRLARAVAPDQAEPLARRNRELRADKQRRTAESKMDALQREKRRHRSPACLMRPPLSTG